MKRKHKDIDNCNITSDDLDKFSCPVEYFVYGTEEDFRDGITKRVSDLNRSIEEECTSNENGKYLSEFMYVAYQAASEAVPDPSQPQRVRDKGHNGMTLSDFTNHQKAKEANLTPAEVAVCRLYTGPLYAPWNYALRYYYKDPHLFESWQTCISVLYGAVLKLSYLSKKGTVYRGVNESKLRLHEKFWKPHADDFSGGVELAFMSTSLDEKVAVEYAKKGSSSGISNESSSGSGSGSSICSSNNSSSSSSSSSSSESSVFVIQFDMASRGASLQWLSQYPHENELLYNPCTCLTTEKFEIRNGIKYIYVKASVCTARPDVNSIFTVTDKIRSVSSSSTLSSLEEVVDKVVRGGFFTGIMKNGQRYKGTHIFLCDYEEHELKEYTGDFLNDYMHGKGKLTWTKGHVYEGDFEENDRSGVGKYTWSDSTVYEGEWNGDKKCGFGKLTWPSGKKYEGDFEDGNMNGKGRYEWPDGTIYEGDFQDGNMSGNGKHTWPDGRIYVGEFKDGKRHGKGFLTKDGAVLYSGDWIEDQHF